jgi:hypothetical protein
VPSKNEADHSTYSVHAGQPGHNRHLGLLDSSLQPVGDALMKTTDYLFQKSN